MPEVRPLISGPTPGPSPYGPWYEQHWQVNAVMLEPADADTMASAEEEAMEEEAYYEEDDRYVDDGSSDAGLPPEEAVIPPDDSYQPLPESEPGAADMGDPRDASIDARPLPPQPEEAPEGSGGPVRY